MMEAFSDQASLDGKTGVRAGARTNVDPGWVGGEIPAFLPTILAASQRRAGAGGFAKKQELAEFVSQKLFYHGFARMRTDKAFDPCDPCPSVVGVF
ncbi:MAG: hypothetical protein ACREP2_07050 [Rhodanobacteraceae bacterium]